jgi:cytochrome P450
MSLTVYAFTLTALTLLIYQCSKIGKRPVGYPPGPPTLPLLGNLHQMPKEKAHLQFQKWAETYGPVYSLMLGTKVMIVLNSDVAVKDLLDRRSGIYSSRPDMYIANIASGGLRFSLLVRPWCPPAPMYMEPFANKVAKRYGDVWRKVRKVIHNTLNINAVQAYIPYQDLENRAMLVRLLEQPEQFIDIVRLYANSLTTQMIFGYRTTSTEDPRFKQFFHVSLPPLPQNAPSGFSNDASKQGFEKLSELLNAGAAALIDFYPLLRSLPDALVPLRKYAKSLHKAELDLYLGHWLDTKRRMQEGTASPSFCVDLALAQKAERWSDSLSAYASGVLLEAGSDTTSSTLIGCPPPPPLPKIPPC